jgi:hypothetical protein
LSPIELDNAKVRYSRAGDAFHYRWAARRCLKLIEPKSPLKYITIESSSESIAAGEYIIDMAEYSDSESGEWSVGYRQLKHSTVRINKPFVLSEIKSTLAGFASRYAGCLICKNGKFRTGAVTFSFVSNRPVSQRIKEVIDRIRNGKAAKSKLQRNLQRISKLKGDDLQAFYQSLSFVDGEGDYIVQKKALQGTMEEYIAGFVDSAEVDQLIALVADRALPESESKRGNGEIWPEDVLKRLGATSDLQLFPAPPEFEKVSLIIKREQHETILKHICQHENPTIIHAAGGVGKSIVARHLAETLPAGSVGIVYDCFGGGKYRNPSEPRHRAQDALVQMANELALRGLCLPLICRQGTQPDALFRSFKERLQQALEKLREINPDSLLVLLIDAADNAEMAARENNDKCFVAPLLREGVPAGCRLIMLCRTERTNLLAPPSSVHLFPLDGFSVNESGAHLRQQHPTATSHDVLEFHRLSGGNPRVQANALNIPGLDLSALLTSLGPTKTTVDDQIYDQLQTAVASLKDKIAGADFKAQVDSICRGLANLPPFIPLDVLATAAGVEVSAIKSFISDLGRPLWHSDDSVQFRDEPTETWFRKIFAANKAQIGGYVNVLEPLAPKYPYVAKVLPQLLLRSESYQRLVNLALSDDFLPVNNPIDARNIRVYRLQFAFKAALKLKRFADAARLAFRAGEEVAGNQRQLELLQANLELLAPLQDVSGIEELAHRQVFEADWPGSQNLYSASLLSSIKDFHGEARSFLRAADRWLRIYFETRNQYKKEHPEEHFRLHEQLTEVHISEFLWTNYNLFGPEQAVKNALTWRPPMMIFQMMRLFIRRLVTAAKYDEIDRVAKYGAKSPYLMLALADRLACVAKFPPKQCLTQTLNFLSNSKKRITKPNYVSNNNPLLPSILSFAEACAAQGLPKNKILAVLDYYTEPTAHFSISSSYNHTDRQVFFRGAALKAVLRGDCQPNPQSLLPPPDPKKQVLDSPGQEASELSRIVNTFLPWYVLRARFIIGDAAAGETNLSQLFTAAEDKIESGYRRKDGINYEIAAIYFEVLALKKSISRAELDSFANGVARKVKPKITLIASLQAAFVSFRLPHLAPLREHLEQNCRTAIEAPGTDGPESWAQCYIDLARAVLPVNPVDARAYFDHAIEAVSKFGDEMVERWQAVVMVAKQAGKDSKPLPELCYRFVRCGEMIGETVVREKYWNRDEVFTTAIQLDPSGAFAALSRWRDRQVGWFGDQLEALATEAINSGILTPTAGWCLSAFAGCNGSPRFTRACLAHEKDPTKRQAILDVAIRDNQLKDASAEKWEELKILANDFRLKPGDIDAWTATSSREYPPRTSYTQAPANPPLQPDNWDKLFENINLLTCSGQHAALISFKGSTSGSTLVNFWQEMIARVPQGKEVDFLNALVANEDVDIYAMGYAIAAVNNSWSQKAGIKRHWPIFLQDLGRRFASHLVNDYHLRSWITNGYLAANDTELMRATAFEVFADSQDLIDASTFFGFARQLAKRLTQPEAEQLLAFALSRFELHIPDDFADGPWNKCLETSDNVTENVTGFIWSTLGSPYSKDRWEAAHCIRRLAENSCQREMDSLVGWMRKGGVQAFGSHLFHFYDLHAKLYLLIALARVSVDDTNLIRRHAKVFADIALTGTPHLLIQKISAEVALQVENHHPRTYTPAIKAKLKKVGKSPFPIRKVKERPKSVVTPWHATNSVSANLKLHFSWDFDRYWFEPLGRLFGVSQEHVIELARDIAVNELQVPESDEHWRDARQAQWNSLEQRGGSRTWSDHGNYPQIDNYSFYYSYHAVMVTAARLLSKMPVIHETRYALDDDEEDKVEHWLRYHQLVRNDGRWLADRRDPAPLKRRDWIKQGAGKDWLWEVNADDFYDCLCNHCPSSGFICVDGNWIDYSGSAIEEIDISSALVNSNSASALASAMRTNDDPWTFGFLDHSPHDMDFTKPTFQLMTWLQPPGESSGQLDTFDPYAKSIHFPPCKVAPKFAAMLKLTADIEFRYWKQPEHSTPSLITEIWSTKEQPQSREREESFRFGSRICASVNLLKELCSKAGKSLILSVHIRRHKQDRYRASDEESLGYIQPSHKIFIFSANGKLEDAGKNYQLG